MKILITYFSQTGNTEKIAEAIHEITSKNHDSYLKRIKEVKESFKNRSDSKNNLSPAKILKKLREILPTDAIIATEVGQNQMWAALYFTSLKPRTFLMKVEFSPTAEWN